MPLKYPENLGVGKPSRNMEAEWWYRAGELLREVGNIEEAEKFFQNGAKKGDGIDIEFFALRDIIWEHQSDTIDIYYWINEFFRLLCLREIEESVQEKKVLKKMGSFVDSKIAEGRLNEPGLQLIKALVFYGEGSKKKAIELLNLLPHNKSPYCRMRNFIINIHK